MKVGDDELSDFSIRLRHLFDVKRRPDGRRFTLPEIAARSAQAGFPISDTYLSHLRTGRAKSPSLQTVQGICAAFKVDIHYFTKDEDPGDETAAGSDVQQSQTAQATGSRLQDVAYRLRGLSDSDIDTVNDLIRTFRQMRGLPESYPD